MFKPLTPVTYVLASTCVPVTPLPITIPAALFTGSILLSVIPAVVNVVTVVTPVVVLGFKSSIDWYGLYLATDILSSLL
jgi:hypothetical protein